MHRRWKSVSQLGVTTALAAVVWLTPFSSPSAHACKIFDCHGADVFPASGDIPQDQLEFTYRPEREQSARPDAGLSGPHLYRVDGDARSEVPLELAALPGKRPSFTVKPAGTLPAGTKLVMEADAPTCRPEARLETSFLVTEAAPAPASLGVLKVVLQRGLLEVGTIAGSCSETLDVAYADLTLELAAGALPFRNVLAYQWMVDGAPYDGFFRLLPRGDDGNGRSDLGRGVERVYALCEPTTSRKPASLVSRNTLGEHRVSVRGVLRDGASVETPEVRVLLACNGPAPAAPDAGVARLTGPAGETTAERSDDTSSATGTDTDLDPRAPQPRTSEGGCSVAPAASAGPTPWVLALATLACALARRARRHRRAG